MLGGCRVVGSRLHLRPRRVRRSRSSSSVSAGDIATFVGYEIGFVLLPGGAQLWTLRGRRRRLLVTAALGWPLGQTLEIRAFSATAAFGARGLFALYPIVVIIPCALVISGRADIRPHDAAGEPMSSRLMWTATAALSTRVVIHCAGFFSSGFPIPSDLTSRCRTRITWCSRRVGARRL